MKRKGTNLAENINPADIPADDVGENIAENDELLQFETPPVTETAADFIEQPNEPERASEPNPEDYRGTLDDKGHPFDPLVHDYPPTKTPGGKWKKRPKGKAPPPLQEGQTEILPNVAYRAEAEKMALLYANLHRVPFGGEGGKVDKESLAPLIDDLERYMMENGHQHINPKWAVLLSGSMYSLMVCQRPTNKEKVLKWLSPVTGFFKKLFNIKDKKPIENKNEQNVTSGGFKQQPKPQPVRENATPSTDENAAGY